MTTPKNTYYVEREPKGNLMTLEAAKDEASRQAGMDTGRNRVYVVQVVAAFQADRPVVKAVGDKYFGVSE